jgi:hypothetical protein
MAKKKVLTEKEVSKTYEIVNTFTDDRQDGNEFPAGGFVTEADFSPDTWKALTEAGDVVLAAPEPELKDDEVIILEIIEA